VKEVQQLTGRMAALSRFVLAGGDKGYPYFQCLKRKKQVRMDQGVRGIIPQVEGVLGHPTSTMQGKIRYPALLVLHSHKSGD